MAREFTKPWSLMPIGQGKRLHDRLDLGLRILARIQQAEPVMGVSHPEQPELDDVVHDLVTALSAESEMAPGILVDRTDDGEVVIAAKDGITGLAMAGSLSPADARIFAQRILEDARIFAQRILEIADAIEGEKAVPSEPNAYHQHLDVCEHCRNNPFDLCPVGAKAFYEVAARPTRTGIIPP